MSYLDLINEFWLKDEEHSFSGSETRLYFFLLKCANRRHWTTDALSFADGDLMHDIRITANTLKEARNRLATTGLIKLDVKKANQKGRKSKEDSKCKYVIIGMKLSKIDNSTHNSTDNSTHNYGDNSTDNNTDGSASQSVHLQAPKIKIEDKDKDIYKGLSQEDIDSFEKYQKWLSSEGFKHVVKIKDQLTPIELVKLRSEYGGFEVARIIEAIDNYKDCHKKYTSLYRTASTWLKRDDNRKAQ